ncbi:hypothetical protein BDV93DRAFT_354015 [Ceratobasidium sp. AG-I]|nr:hypothetical protein BDV93DRAFT_354015 [Ceratobasidium sp. AG-I]
MVSPLAKARSSVRHRIQDNAPLYELPEVAPGSPLLWNLESHPCDVQPDSKIKLKIIEKHFPSPRNRIGYLEYLVSDVIDKPAIHLQVDNPASQLMGFSSTAKRWDHGEPFAVSLTFPDCDRVDNAYLVALDKADAIMSSKIGPLEGLGKFRDLFKTLIDVGQLVAEMNSSAKLVVGVCSMVWEHLEKLQRLHDDLRKLLKGLENIIQIVEFVKEYATNSLLGDTITALLRLIEDSSNFMLGYFSKRAPVRLLRSTFDGSAPDRVGELLQEFTDLRDEFDRKVRVQVLATVITSSEYLYPENLAYLTHIPPQPSVL